MSQCITSWSCLQRLMPLSILGLEGRQQKDHCVHGNGLLTSASLGTSCCFTKEKKGKRQHKGKENARKGNDLIIQKLSSWCYQQYRIKVSMTTISPRTD